MKPGLFAPFFCLFATAASAHAFLQHAEPGAGASLKSAPKQLILNFTETLEPSFSGAEVSDARGYDVEASSAVVNGTSVRAALKPLGPGKYQVKWHAVSVDSHRTEGQFTFTVQP
jgi:hypothetical protein